MPQEIEGRDWWSATSQGTAGAWEETWHSYERNWCWYHTLLTPHPLMILSFGASHTDCSTCYGSYISNSDYIWVTEALSAHSEAARMPCLEKWQFPQAPPWNTVWHPSFKVQIKGKGTKQDKNELRDFLNEKQDKERRMRATIRR